MVTRKDLQKNTDKRPAPQPIKKRQRRSSITQPLPQSQSSSTRGGGINPFNFIINPETGAHMSLFSSGGKTLLKNLIKLYKSGGDEGEL